MKEQQRRLEWRQLSPGLSTLVEADLDYHPLAGLTGRGEISPRPDRRAPEDPENHEKESPRR